MAHPDYNRLLHIATNGNFEAHLAKRDSLRSQRQLRASGIGSISHLNVIGLVTSHHLVARDPGRDGVHDWPLRRCNTPAALGLLAGQLNRPRASQVGHERPIVYENAAPDHFTWLA